MTDDTPAPDRGSVIRRFPGPGTRLPRPRVPARDLGLTALSRALGPQPHSPRGHWCDRCQGIWYSYLGEARCPVCGGRC